MCINFSPALIIIFLVKVCSFMASVPDDDDRDGSGNVDLLAF
jgi:hypothetical protein